VNLALLREHIASAPGRAMSLRLIAFLAHLDALLCRYGKAGWRMVSL